MTSRKGTGKAAAFVEICDVLLTCRDGSLDEEIVFGIQVVGRVFFHHYVHARTQTVEDAVYVADGLRDPVFDRLDSVRELVEGSLHHTVHARRLDLRPLGYVAYQSAHLLRLGAERGGRSGEVFGDEFQFGGNVLNQFARGHDGRQSV